MRKFICLFVISNIYILFGTLSAAGFKLLNDPIDVVIPSTEKDLSVLDLCIEGIKKYGKNIRRVIVVSNKRLTKQAEWFNEQNYPFSIHAIAKELANGDDQILIMLQKPGARTGWYYQQLLKLYAPSVIPNISSNVLILDADTIFLRPVDFLNRQNGGMYNPAVEYHLPYFKHADLLLPGLKKQFPKYSGVAHHMLLQRPIVEALFQEVCEYHQKPFWQIFCNLVDKKDLPFSGASEYEIYFNYVFSKTNQVSLRKLKFKNITKKSEIKSFKNKNFNYVNLHSYERVES